MSTQQQPLLMCRDPGVLSWNVLKTKNIYLFIYSVLYLVLSQVVFPFGVVRLLKKKKKTQGEGGRYIKKGH